MPELQRALDTALSQAPTDAKQRFLLLTGTVANGGATIDVGTAA